MSRIRVKTFATAGSLKFVGVELPYVLEVTPNEVFGVGNSIGGYLAAPLQKKPQIWGLWRLSGGDAANMNPARIQRIKNSKPERVAIDGRQYLLATSSGSARNGIIHNYKVIGDPVLLALLDNGCDKLTGEVTGIGGAIGLLAGTSATTEWCKHLEIASDGDLVLSPYWSGDRGDVGYLEELESIDPDATYVVWLHRGHDGVSMKWEVKVAVRANADRQKVAQQVTQFLRRANAEGAHGWRLDSVPVA
jgi:hypothetical protein